MAVIKALTIQEPFGSLIVDRHKEHETRSWTTKYRGLMVIHVGKTLAINWQDKVFLSLLADCGIREPGKLPLGCAIGIAELTAIYHTEDVMPCISDRELAFGDWSPGRAAWKLENVQRFPKPIPCRGQQYLWDWTEKLPEGIAI